MQLIQVPVWASSPYEWWTGKSGIAHPYIMLSEVLKKIKFEKSGGVKLFVDSGGYQLQQDDLYLSPERVALWQESVDGDVRFILDHPPVLRTINMTSQVPLHGDKFNQKLELTIDSIKRMFNTYKKDKETYAVLQGETIDEIIEWRDKIMKTHDFDGWGIGSTFGDIAQFRVKIKLLGEIGVKKIHLFGVGDIFLLIRIARYMKDYKIDYCTFDSTAYLVGRSAEVYSPMLGFTCITFKRKYEHKNLRLCCDCSVCRTLKPNESLADEKITEFNYKASMHNIEFFNQCTKQLVEYAKYDDLLDLLEKTYPLHKEDSKIDKRKTVFSYE